MNGPAEPVIQHWYDFICPFCYVAQDRNLALRAGGVAVEELAFPIHPEIGPGGSPAPLRQGPTYDFLRREAELAGLPLAWSDRIGYSRPALQRSETVRRHRPNRHADFCREVFHAYFGQGEDIEASDVLDACARAAGVGDLFDGVRDACEVEADALVDASTRQGAAVGVSGTPAWLIGSKLVVGLHPRAEFEEIARSLTSGSGK